MELDMVKFFKSWSPKLTILTEAAKRKREDEAMPDASPPASQ
jgi:hypothetical protein